MFRFSHLLALIAVLNFLGVRAVAHPDAKCQLQTTTKPRIFLLSDIDNEPDDAQSLVRLLLYSNEFQIEGLVATTSFWLNDTTRPDHMEDIVLGYKESLHNLKIHASGWPEPDYLLSLIKSGSTRYGMDGVGEGQDSEGSNLLIDAVDSSEEPLWVPLWGGANTLAQALWKVNSTRSDIDKFVSKLRVYSISDQDNAGPWIRRHWPSLFYIASVHAFNRYGNAAWGGMSGDDYYHFPNNANKEVISPAWIERNIQIGPLGGKYPSSEFIMEGKRIRFFVSDSRALTMHCRRQSLFAVSDSQRSFRSGTPGVGILGRSIQPRCLGRGPFCGQHRYSCRRRRKNHDGLPSNHLAMENCIPE